MSVKNKRLSSVEDQPMTRVLRQRELVESMKHENEILRLDLTKESRDARKNNSSSAATDIGRYFYIFFERICALISIIGCKKSPVDT
jgi:hypothetical protein